MTTKRRKNKKNNITKAFARLIGLIALTPIAIFSLTLACDIAISNNSSGRIYDNIDDIPFNETCVVLGTTPYSKNMKSGNPYFNNRMNAVAELYKNGKIKRIIVSGDSSKNYDETKKMHEALVKRGIPRKAIIKDTKGKNTIKSIKEVKRRFKLDEFTIVSQKFHNERALFIADHYKLKAIGYNADDMNIKKGYRVYFREKLARIKVFIDILTE